MSLCLGQELFLSHPFVEYNVAPDDKFYPIGLSFVELVRLYYGAHKIKTSIPLNWIITAQSGTLSAEASLSDYETDLPSIETSWNGVKREEDYFLETFISGNFFLYQVEVDNYDESDSDVDHEVSASRNLEINIEIFGAPDPIAIYGGLYYPRCSIKISGNVYAEAFDFDVTPPDASDHEFYFEAAIDPITPPPGTLSYSLACKLFDKDIELHGYKYDISNAGSGSAVVTVSGGPPSDMEISVGKWWPYDPNDGLGPIWDEDTGAKLRNKF